MRAVRIDEAAAVGARGNPQITTPLSLFGAGWTSSSKWFFVDRRERPIQVSIDPLEPGPEDGMT
jgi:hypothetical protein